MKKNQIEKSIAKLGDIMTHFGSNRPWKGFEIGLTEDEHIAFNELIENMNSYEDCARRK